ncbi:hypothetical protein TIFTF001_023125 [Ficus carica]|uniref:Uncharacterized protein n=1 Tax=Ficus carica TaxID=3494 RepID=A0AA88DDG5_FICCA|nr:hypothetical protein TIFTF001_023125 [Ficus carica]
MCPGSGPSSPLSSPLNHPSPGQQTPSSQPIQPVQSELRGFPREEKNDRVEQSAHLKQLQESDPIPMPSEIHSGENVAENIDIDTRAGNFGHDTVT